MDGLKAVPFKKWNFSVVGAPAFMRGKERFSAPGNGLDSIMRFSAGETTLALRNAISGNPLSGLRYLV
jgi:hypothetical protein